MTSRSRTFVISATVALGAVVFVLWAANRRIDRIDYVTALASATDPSTSGSAQARDEFPQLIVPERHEPSFHWLAQTRQMLASRTARLRHVDYDNAPAGRPVSTTSPYRWWLGALAVIEHSIHATPLVAAVEAAGRWSDPLLLLILIVAGTLLVGSKFGPAPAAVFALGAVTLFPLGSEFLPGMPDVRSLAIAIAIGGILLMVAGIAPAPSPPGHAPTGRTAPARWFAAAGLLGGLGVWTSAGVQVPILIGILIGGVLATGIACSARANQPPAGYAALPWRHWALWGGGTVLVGSLIEYAPNHFPGWQRDTLHPLDGLAWIVAGELLHRISTRPAHRDRPRQWRDTILIAVAVVVVAIAPFALWKSATPGFLERGFEALRLARLPGAAAAENTAGWARHDIGTLAFWTSLAPIIVVFGIAGLVWRRTDRQDRIRIALALGPVLVAGAMAIDQLRWWAVVDATLLPLAVIIAQAVARAATRSVQWVAAALVVATVALGLTQLWPPNSDGPKTPITGTEAQEINERSLARWLTLHAGTSRPIVYAPPHETLTLSYYGNLRGLGTFSAENEPGFRASVMIAGASTMEAAQALLQSREVRYIVIPSWDSYFSDFARLYLAKSMGDRPSLLIQELRRMNLPPWIRPVAYQMVPIGGLEHEWVLVFEVVAEQSPVAANSRLAEYLVEIGDLDRAAAVGEALRKYPGNVGALAALAQVQAARNDAAGAAETARTLASLVAAGGDRNLPWDRRVSVAIALGRADQVDLARVQTQRCLEQMDDRKLRALPTGELYNLMVLVRAFGLQPPTPALTQLALELLPPDLRRQI